MTTSKQIIKTSKILSLLLRHKPQEANIVLDKDGWTDIEDLIEKFSHKFYPIDLAQLKEVVDKNDKKRFAFNDAQTKIRASQGHSIEVDLNLKPVQPPEILYHGTVEKFLSQILKNGLQKQNRQHVHLSKDLETATKVGSRRGKPIILEVNAEQMVKQGYNFYLSENNVWLTDNVPTEFIKLK